MGRAPDWTAVDRPFVRIFLLPPPRPLPARYSTFWNLELTDPHDIDRSEHQLQPAACCMQGARLLFVSSRLLFRFAGKSASTFCLGAPTTGQSYMQEIPKLMMNSQRTYWYVQIISPSRPVSAHGATVRGMARHVGRGLPRRPSVGVRTRRDIRGVRTRALARSISSSLMHVMAGAGGGGGCARWPAWLAGQLRASPGQHEVKLRFVSLHWPAGAGQVADRAMGQLSRSSEPAGGRVNFGPLRKQAPTRPRERGPAVVSPALRAVDSN
nr:unnamed protein product [Digitaria exilis]